MKLQRIHLIFALVFIQITHMNVYAQFNILYPNSNDTLTSGTYSTINFQNQTNTSIKLSYSNDYGSTLTLIKDSINTINYKWLVPSLDTGKCLIKAEAKGYSNPYLIWEKKFAHTAEIRSVEMSKDGKYILSSSSDFMVKIWDILTSKCIDSASIGEGCYSAHFIFGVDSILITAGNSGYIWDRKLKSVNRFYSFTNKARTSQVHPFLRKIAVGSYNGDLCVFDLNNLNLPIATFSSPFKSAIYTTDFSPDGKYVAYGCDSGFVDLIDLSLNLNYNSYGRHGTPGINNTIWSISFSTDSKRFASTGVDQTLKVWDIPLKASIFSINAHSFHVRASKYHPSGNYILTAGLDSLIKQWDPQTGSQISIAMNHNNQVISAEYSPTGDTIVSAGRGDPNTSDFPIRLWKNIQYSDLSDSVLVSIKYPVSFNTSSIDTLPDKIIYLPVSYKNVPQTNTPRDLGFNAILKLSLPLELLDLKSNAIHTGKIGEFDTVSITIPNFKWQDTVTLLKLRTLYNQDNINKIRIIGIEFDKLSNYYLMSDTSKVQINPVCGSDMINTLSFAGYVSDLKVYPNPLTDGKILLEVDLVEDADLSINIVNIEGLIVKKIVKGMFKRGRYVFMDDLTNLINGCYFVQMVHNKNTKSRELIILK